jgi:hypothetical protein
VADDVLSALSVAVPVRDWLAPSVDTVEPAAQLLTPDGVSEQLNETATSVLFQPFAFAAGVRDPVIVGADVSSLTVTAPVPTLPTASVAVAVLVTPAVGVSVVWVTVAGVGPEATPDPPVSVAAQVTVAWSSRPRSGRVRGCR